MKVDSYKVLEAMQTAIEVALESTKEDFGIEDGQEYNTLVVTALQNVIATKVNIF